MNEFQFSFSAKYKFLGFCLISISFFMPEFSKAERFVASTPSFQEADEFVYDPIGRRDPFKPWRPFSIKKAMNQKGIQPSGSETKVVEITDPLLKHEVEKYSVLAIMWDVAKPRALIKDPEGSSHIVFQGSRLGRNGGSIRSLREGEVVINESVDVNGEIKTTTKILEVNKNDFSFQVKSLQPLTASPPSPIAVPQGIKSEGVMVPSGNKSLPEYFDSAEDAMNLSREEMDPTKPAANSKNRSRPTTSATQSPKTTETKQ
jgi:type IV pilus assembly protein PilP